MKMRELEQRTGVGREAIRNYIRAGLVSEPERPRRNVANYSAEHVDRIMLVCRLKDEHFLPLNVIKELLDNTTPGDASDHHFDGIEFLLAARLNKTDDNKVLVSELVESTSLSAEEVEQLEQDQIISIQTEEKCQVISAQDALLVRTIANLRDVGFDRESGFLVDGIMKYKLAAESLAEQEIDDFLERIPGTRSNQEAAVVGEMGVEIVGRLFLMFHTRAIVQELEKRRIPRKGAARKTSGNR